MHTQWMALSTWCLNSKFVCFAVSALINSINFTVLNFSRKLKYLASSSESNIISSSNNYQVSHDHRSYERNLSNRV